MEHQIMRRRMSRILDHVAAKDELPPPNHHKLFPMNCSSILNTVIRRCDNRMFFARQGSSTQACFMQQVSVQQYFGPHNSSQSSLPLSCSCSGNGDSSSQHSREPLFSRQAQVDSNLSTSRDDQPVRQDFMLSSTEPPKFARTDCGKDNEWSPRVDVAESGSNYFVIVELPGASITDIRVEVDDQNLTVMGKRSTQKWREANGSGTLDPTYHRREILQGPYRVVWPVPDDVNKGGVSAEFVDGFLQITLPKQ